MKVRELQRKLQQDTGITVARLIYKPTNTIVQKRVSNSGSSVNSDSSEEPNRRRTKCGANETHRNEIEMQEILQGSDDSASSSNDTETDEESMGTVLKNQS